jgi:hypothetical protein
VWGSIPIFIALIGWLWPTKGKDRLEHGVRGRLTVKEGLS